MKNTDWYAVQKEYELSNNRKGIEDSILPFLPGNELEKHIHLTLLMATVPLPIETIVGASLRTQLKLESDDPEFIHILSDELLETIPFAIDDILATISSMLDKGDLIVTLTKKETKLYKTRLSLVPEMLVKIKSLHAILPMRIKPYELVNNSDNPHMMVKYKNIVTKQKIDDDIELNLDHINRMNSIPMVISETMKSLVPVNNPPTKFELAVEYADYREHYFTHYYDSRGRTYCQGYYLTTQGTDMQKSLSVINDPQIIPLD